jgi:DNA-binding SARP family transcriptional activator/tetratricopeptide (TPR) repeat protein
VFGRGKLHRKRLVEILEANLDKRLILVVAPAGYGKTMLLADLTAHIDRPVCWVRLTEHDRDSARLCSILVESLGARFRRMRRRLDPRGLESLSPDKTGRWVGRGIAEAATPEFVLMFDDVHLVGASAESAAFLAGLIDALPRHVCCILAGREALDLPLAGAVAADEVLAIGAGDLALAEEELDGLLNLDGEGQTTAEVRDRLMSESRGWIAGIQLLRLRGLEALQASVPAPKDLTFQYFGSEVLAKQTEAMQRFALESSVLPVMTAEAVEAVCRVEDGARWLRMAVRKGLFITATGLSSRSYEYHPLFREFLRLHIDRIDPRGARQAKLRGARYLANHAAEEQAVELYWESGARNRALRLAERAAPSRKRSAQVGILREWVTLADNDNAPALKLRAELIEALVDADDRGKAHMLVKSVLRDYQMPRLERLRFQAWDLKLRDSRRHPRRIIKGLEAVLHLVRNEPYSAAYRTASSGIAYKYWEMGRDLSRAEELARASLRSSKGPTNAWARMYSQLLLSAILHARGMAAEERAFDMRLKVAGEKWGGVARIVGGEVDALSFHRDLHWEESLREYARLKKEAQALGIRWSERLARYEISEIRSNVGLYEEAIRGHTSMLEQVNEDDAIDRKVQLWSILGMARSYRRAGDLAMAQKALERTRELPFALRGSPEIALERLAIDLFGAVPRTVSRLRSLASHVSSVSGPANVEMMARYMIGYGLWMAGCTDKASQETLTAIRLANRIAYLHYVAGELLACPSFAQFLLSTHQGYPALERISSGLRRANLLARREARHSAAGISDGSVFLRTLGDGSVSMGGEIFKVKPLFLEVLAFVANRGRVPVETLMEAFWPDAPLKRQRTNMHTALYGIRSVLGKEVIIRDGSMLCVGHSSLVCDAVEFERLHRECTESSKRGLPDIDLLRRALVGYEGPFLNGYARPWVIDRRRELERLYLRLLVEYGNACLQQGMGSDAAEFVMKAIGQEPLDEPLRILAARLLASSGRRAHALQVLHEYRDLVNAELGISPSAALTELERGLMDEGSMLAREVKEETLVAI